MILSKDWKLEGGLKKILVYVLQVSTEVVSSGRRNSDSVRTSEVASSAASESGHLKILKITNLA